MRLGDVVRGAVVLNDLGVVDRDVGRALLEVGHRVPALIHDLGHEPVGVADRRGRVIDEPCLDGPPTGAEPRASVGLERVDRQLLDALLPLRERRLRAALAPVLVDRPGVLRPEAAP